MQRAGDAGGGFRAVESRLAAGVRAVPDRDGFIANVAGVMRTLALLVGLIVLVVSIPTSPVLGQEQVQIQGRVEDAGSRLPIVGARVFPLDSSTVVLTDSAGRFSLRLPADSPLTLHVDRIGYQPLRFDLPVEAPNRIAVLLLEQAPIELEGLTAVGERALDALQRNLTTRRYMYRGAVRAYDREWLDRFGLPGGSVYDLVRLRIPGIFECFDSPGNLCVRARFWTPANPSQEEGIFVCIDSWQAWGAVSELEVIPLDAVALIEVFSRTRINVFTRQWMLSRASRNRSMVLPLEARGCDS